MAKNARMAVDSEVRQTWNDRRARHGWHTIGPGCARFGWAAYTAAGDGLFLGCDRAEAVSHCAAVRSARASHPDTVSSDT